ncbi:MAG: hypothetical protein MJK12_06730 [Colwellia sp.]|nr:hypothetical protein [Colwellia sp.]
MTNKSSNTDQLHDAKIINKNDLSDAQKKAIDSLSQEEIDSTIPIAKKLKDQLDDSEHNITGLPF